MKQSYALRILHSACYAEIRMVDKQVYVEDVGAGNNPIITQNKSW